MDLEGSINAATLQWIKRLILKPNSNITAVSMSYLLQTSDLTNFLSYKRPLVPTRIEHDPFYSKMFKLWDKFHGFHSSNESSIREEHLWCNKWITSNGAALYWRAWYRGGIKKIKDIYHAMEGCILSHVEFSERFHLPCPFLDMLRLELSIPLHHY